MNKHTKFSIGYYAAVFTLIMLLQMLFYSHVDIRKELTYKQFKDALANGEIARVVILPVKIIGEFKTAENSTESSAKQISDGPTTPWRLQVPQVEKKMARQFSVMRLPNMSDETLLQELQQAGVDYSGRINSNFLQNFMLNWILPFLLFFAIWGIVFRRMSASSGRMMSFGRNNAKLYAQSPENQATFKDLAGVDEAVEEVQEIVHFLKAPEKYTQLGGKLPKGVLLVGPPGTGKTLLGRAIAGEANVPFFQLSGSDFVEMFVGVGAARVRDLFKQAKEKAPCIIFIDEIDAIGKSRARAGVASGGYDERENTLNQLLVEMDGFDSSVGVIIIGATNRPEVLDAALLRPGRFDRQILVDKPDMKGRVEIFRIHTRSLKLEPDIDFDQLAAQTPGFAGAEIANVCNEAALLAARKDKKLISKQEFQEAIERVVAGLEKKNKRINDKERRIVSYHEAGHTLVGYFTPGSDPVQKVSIVPRGIGALGYTLQTPLEDRYLLTQSELNGKLRGLLGGRAAEELIFGQVSTGAANDLERATKLARNMVTVYGMSEKLPNLFLSENQTTSFLGEVAGQLNVSQKTAQIIDEEIERIIKESYQAAKETIQKHRHELELLADRLLEKEVVEAEEITEILESSKR